jgi:hypothetical protein
MAGDPSNLSIPLHPPQTPHPQQAAPFAAPSRPSWTSTSCVRRSSCRQSGPRVAPPLQATHPRRRERRLRPRYWRWSRWQPSKSHRESRRPSQTSRGCKGSLERLSSERAPPSRAAVRHKWYGRSLTPRREALRRSAATAGQEDTGHRDKSFERGIVASMPHQLQLGQVVRDQPKPDNRSKSQYP